MSRPAAPAPVAIPELANLPTPVGALPVKAEPIAAATTETTITTTTTTTTAEPAPPAPNEAGDAPMTAGGTNVPAGLPPLNVAAPPTTLPGLALAPPPTMPGAGAFAMQTTTLPEVGVDAPAKSRMGGRTWMTRLAPAIIPKNTNFNYRRQILPDVIYRKQYDRENNHLPLAVTREDYAMLLIQSVASNDLNATRALLNTGLSINTVDGYGQSLLSVARRAGAHDTERLLIARGAS